VEKLNINTTNLIPYLQNKMKIEYNNLYIDFILPTLHRAPIIAEKSRERMEKNITGQ